jgi:transcriptional regulator with XRE-family HTH domain
MTHGTPQIETPAQALRRIRKERDTGLVSLAGIVGLSPATLSGIENGGTITGDAAIRLSRWSGLPLEFLYPAEPVADST